jgi:CDP-glucose 4,6-dehydratase
MEKMTSQSSDIPTFQASFLDFYYGKRVFLTGHTGFKGGWLALWLANIGAEIHGYALEPPTEPNFFAVCGLQKVFTNHTIADIRAADALTKAVQKAKPDIVFHLAAQPLVRQSYEDPVATYATNVMGTVNLLEAVKQTPSVRAVVNVTTDKCYENREWVWPYRENEPLGGLDPYSSSKACSELVTAAYRNSFFNYSNPPSALQPSNSLPGIATARAGNVIGGGDWAKDRLIPDFLRAIEAGQILIIRSPDAVRPWQHALEALSGYLMLAKALYEQGSSFADAWNFGPDEGDSHSVQWIVDYLCRKIPNARWKQSKTTQPHEAHTLRLDSSKARALLGWRPRWSLRIALEKTLEWHQAWKQGSDMAGTTLKQIQQYAVEGQR